MRNRIVLAVALVATLFSSPILSANDFGLSLLYGGFGGAYNPQLSNSLLTPPYFSMHPPVYYGQRYYRPYGASPFAAWPQLQPNPAYAPAPMPARAAAAIINPYCAPVTEISAPAELSSGSTEFTATTPRPLMIDNPFASVNSRTVSVTAQDSTSR